jgi:uncharacterized protein YodC (DUF2158 family)
VEENFKVGNVVTHKASSKKMVVLSTDLDCSSEVFCRYFNEITGNYCEKTFNKCEFN